MCIGRVGYPLLRAVGFAQFGHHDDAFGSDREFGDARRADHARQQFHAFVAIGRRDAGRSEENTSELQSLMRSSYAVLSLKKKQTNEVTNITHLKHHHHYASQLTIAAHTHT